jgi:hypothetical protein
MRQNLFRSGSYLLAAALAVPTAMLAKTANSCTAGTPTAASYTWDFSKEANNLLDQVRIDAAKIHARADDLQILTNSPDVSWQSHASDLTRIRTAVNDMGAKLCRLETIRRVVQPWQQKEIDRVAVATKLMADNVEDAILFLNSHHQELWSPTYVRYAANIQSESVDLSHTLASFEEYAQARHEVRDLSKTLGVRSGD